MAKLAPPKIEKLSSEKQQRLHGLLDKNSEGDITRSEKVELEELAAEAEKLMVANAKRLADFSRREGNTTTQGSLCCLSFTPNGHEEVSHGR